jgi:hypothetical protein
MTPTDLETLSKRELVSLAKKYTVYFTTKSGKGSTSNYESLSKEELVQLLKDDRDYQRALNQLTRIDILKERLKKTSKDSEDIMNVILDVFQDTISEPIPGRYFTFRYFAKTPRLLYDQHPLIACLGVYEWGFRGLNFHLNKERNYTWPEVNSGLLMVENDEISYMKTVRYSKILVNP